jgi:deoxyadenosine/deoxycytidine kinase
VFTTRFLQQNAAASTSKAAFLLTERSVLTDRCVFVETGKDQGYLNALEVAAYEAWYHGVVAALPNVVHVLLALVSIIMRFLLHERVVACFFFLCKHSFFDCENLFPCFPNSMS